MSETKPQEFPAPPKEQPPDPKVLREAAAAKARQTQGTREMAAYLRIRRGEG